MDSVDERYKTPVLESLRMHLTAALELADQLGHVQSPELRVRECGNCVSSYVKSALEEVARELSCAEHAREALGRVCGSWTATPYGWTDTRALHVAGKYVDGKWGVSCHRGSFPDGSGGEVVTGANLSELLRLVAKRVEDDDSAADAIKTSNTDEG